MSQRKAGNRVEVRNQEHETLLLQMQFFCLDPRQEIYDRIVNSPRLVMEQSEYMPGWSAAALTKYGRKWAADWKPPTRDGTSPMPPAYLNTIVLDEYRVKHAELAVDILRRLETRPSGVQLDKCWYLFFATGEYQYLRAAFGVAGNLLCSDSLQKTALDCYEQFRVAYQNRAQDDTTEAMRSWARLADEIASSRDRIDNSDQLLGTTAEDIVKELRAMALEHGQHPELELEGEKYSDDEEELTPAKQREREQVREAGKLFDKLAEDVFKKIK